MNKIITKEFSYLPQSIYYLIYKNEELNGYWTTHTKKSIHHCIKNKKKEDYSFINLYKSL